ncbi:acyl dehydratase [Aromatoleum diolicum]|uniref:Acyl dehydratase n=2 Tax=Aromatoleum diolicum TaxID=75796 RepID=A0ABX1Q7I2_9RHOO|nr:acyl dehydratase [Aromatoleum diolicum]
MHHRYLDDFTPGERFVTAGITLTEAQIIDFAMMYDPQPFHLDTDAAARSPYGGLIASGFQTVALTFRLFIQTGIIVESSIGSPGIDELRWLAPVRPGDTLHAEIEVLEVKPSRSKPERGIARLLYKTVNQHGDAVASYIGNHLLKRAPTLSN